MEDDIDFAQHMETVARALLGEPNSKRGHEWRYGRNGSLSIDLKAGTWFDHESKEGGGVLALIKLKKGIKGPDALRFLRDLGCIIREDKPRPNGEIPYDEASDPFKNISFKKKAPPNDGTSFRIVKTWPYVDENGAELFEVCRLENGEIDADGKPHKTYSAGRVHQQCERYSAGSLSAAGTHSRGRATENNLLLGS